MRYPGNNANGKKYLARHAVKKCQIKNFSAGAREHVIIKDIVGRNWLPTQNIAQLCFILICKGEKEKHPNRQHQVSTTFADVAIGLLLEITLSWWEISRGGGGRGER